jgi:hypothetical protein
MSHFETKAYLRLKKNINKKMPVLKMDFNSIQNNLKQLLKNNELINELKITNDLSLKTIKYANNVLVKQLINISNKLDSNEVKDSLDVIEGNSDLIPNQYEGGFKLWQSLEDLINYLSQFNIIDNYLSHKNVNILEVNINLFDF